MAPRNGKRLFTPDELLVVFDMWEDNKTRSEIACALNVSVWTIDLRRKDQLASLPNRQGSNGGPRGPFVRTSGKRINDTPTPQQIEEMESRKMEVQARWSAEVRAQRLQGIPDTTQHVRDIAAAYRDGR